MTNPRFTVLLTTIGRSTLPVMLRSLQQLGSTDELLVVTDGPCPQVSGMVRDAGLVCSVTQFTHDPPAQDWGHSLRNVYASRATGDYVLHADDDDAYLPGGLEQIRAGCTRHFGKLVVFRMAMRHGTVPSSPVIRLGNIGTPCGAVPKDPARWGRWTSRVGGDADFYVGCRFEVAWEEDVVYVVRPHDWPPGHPYALASRLLEPQSNGDAERSS